MFTHLNDYTKAASYYSITLLLALLIALFVTSNAAPIITMGTPLIAVLLMQFVVTRDGYSKAGWAELGLGRLGLRKWSLALLAPLLVLLFTYSVAWSTGIAAFVVSANAGSFWEQLLDVMASLVIVTVFAFGEEIGWRGYMLPRLVALGPRRATLVTGFLHGVFHLPVIIFTPFYHGAGSRWIIIPLFLLTLTAAGGFYGYLRLTTGSVWVVALAHAAFDVFWDHFDMVTVAASPLAMEYLAGESGVLTLIGTAAVAGWLLYRLGRPAHTAYGTTRHIEAQA